MIDLILCSALSVNTTQLPTVFAASDHRGTSVQGDRGRVKASDDRGTSVQGDRGQTKATSDDRGSTHRGDRGK